MPDIELHGVSLSDVERDLRRAFKDAEYAPEIVIVAQQVAETVVDLKGTPCPFLRIVGTTAYVDRDIADMRRRLKPLNLDVEVAHLEKFILKSEL